MKTFITFILLFGSLSTEANCRKWMIADKILGSLTDMVDAEDTNCAEKAQMWQEDFDSLPKFISCQDKNVNEVKYVCYRPKQMTDELMADVDELPWIRICKRYRPQIEDLMKSRCETKR